MKLLIAEDEAIIRMDLKETLQDLGYEVVAEARSGREAVQKAFAFAPDCALMDAHMDGDDGFAAAQEIAQAQLCPVVMVTAYAQHKQLFIGCRVVHQIRSILGKSKELHRVRIGIMPSCRFCHFHKYFGVLKIICHEGYPFKLARQNRTSVMR